MSSWVIRNRLNCPISISYCRQICILKAENPLIYCIAFYLKSVVNFLKNYTIRFKFSHLLVASILKSNYNNVHQTMIHKIFSSQTFKLILTIIKFWMINHINLLEWWKKGQIFSFCMFLYHIIIKFLMNFVDKFI